ncbi:MAG: CDP-alcohol phosphatidyltransferase family protein [Syntrophobacteraceae bacterium]|nr:CDP-alcohol phosphatidyltransferase family protein [Syntrophobacteraceae bacterium]
MNIPNLLTLARIFLTPLLVWLLLGHDTKSAFCVFVFAGLTDALDGLLARVLNQKSRLGSFLDPMADKLLLVTSFIALWIIPIRTVSIPAWLLFIAVGRDIVILSGSLALFLNKVRFEIRPLISSKLTTLFQLLVIFTVLGRSFFELPGWMYTMLFVVTAFFSVVSGWRYVSVGMAMYRLRGKSNTM